jgi:hypothetical protein
MNRNSAFAVKSAHRKYFSRVFEKPHAELFAPSDANWSILFIISSSLDTNKSTCNLDSDNSLPRQLRVSISDAERVRAMTYM